MDDNQFSDVSFWMQRNWSGWAGLSDFGMFYWMAQVSPGRTMHAA